MEAIPLSCLVAPLLLAIWQPPRGKTSKPVTGESWSGRKVNPLIIYPTDLLTEHIQRETKTVYPQLQQINEYAHNDKKVPKVSVAQVYIHRHLFYIALSLGALNGF